MTTHHFSSSPSSSCSFSSLGGLLSASASGDFLQDSPHFAAPNSPHLQILTQSRRRSCTRHSVPGSHLALSGMTSLPSSLPLLLPLSTSRPLSWVVDPIPSSGYNRPSMWASFSIAPILLS